MRIAVALSGGVDSSLTARLLQEAGHEVIGITMQLFDKEANPTACAGQLAVERAQVAAEHLGIEHYVRNIAQEFKDTILRYAWDTYKGAETPSPCVFCNEEIKFKALLEFSKTLGCEKYATGHYVRVEQRGSRHVLLRGTDLKKDQSYFLSGLDSDTLSHCIFPLGELTKPEVRVMAAERELKSAKHADSQNVCILEENMTFAETLQNMFREKVTKGVFKDEVGNVLKSHEGVHRYTVGQRHGLGVLIPTQKVWVKEIQSPDVIVTTDPDQLLEKECTVRNLRWNIESPPRRLEAQIRYAHKAQSASLEAIDDAHWRVRFDAPVRAVSPGQIIAFYDGDVVLGRGVLTRPVA